MSVRLQRLSVTPAAWARPDADDEAAAVRAMVDATTRALEEIGQGEHYPAAIRVEPVAELAAA